MTGIEMTRIYKNTPIGEKGKLLYKWAKEKNVSVDRIRDMIINSNPDWYGNELNAALHSARIYEKLISKSETAIIKSPKDDTIEENALDSALNILKAEISSINKSIKELEERKANIIKQINDALREDVSNDEIMNLFRSKRSKE